MEEDEKILREAIKKDPFDAYARYNLGLLLKDLGRDVEGENEYIKAKRKYLAEHLYGDIKRKKFKTKTKQDGRMEENIKRGNTGKSIFFRSIYCVRRVYVRIKTLRRSRERI
ncbi:TPA_asm: hp [Altiarchaeum virus]|nr:TPA_asm: hp [Altiarchaeum virus]